MQSYFPNGPVSAAPYASAAQIPLEPEPIYARKKVAKHEVIAGVYQHSDRRPLMSRKIAGKSQRELRHLGPIVENPAPGAAARPVGP